MLTNYAKCFFLVFTAFLFPPQKKARYCPLFPSPQSSQSSELSEAWLPNLGKPPPEKCGETLPKTDLKIKNVENTTLIKISQRWLLALWEFQMLPG